MHEKRTIIYVQKTLVSISHFSEKINKYVISEKTFSGIKIRFENLVYFGIYLNTEIVFRNIFK